MAQKSTISLSVVFAGVLFCCLLGVTRVHAGYDMLSSTPIATSSDLSSTFGGRGLHVSSNGDLLLFSDISSDDVEKYDFGTNYELSTLSSMSSQLASSTDYNPYTTFLSPNEAYLYVLDSDGVLRFYILSTPGDLSTAVLQYATSSSDYIDDRGGFFFTSDGSYLFVTKSNGISKYFLSSSWNLSTMQRIQTVGGLGESFNDLQFTPDGKYLYLLGKSSNQISEFFLTSPFDLTTITSTGLLLDNSDLGITNNIRGFEWSYTGHKLYVSDQDYVFQYDRTSYYGTTTDAVTFCGICTRWISSDPSRDELLATTSVYNFNGSFYVSEEDYIDGWGEETYYMLSIRPKTSGTSTVWDDLVPVQGINTYGHTFTNLSTGSYEQCLTMYAVDSFSLFNFSNTYNQFFKECRNFSIATTTSQSEIEQYWDDLTAGVIDTASIIDEGSDYVGSVAEMGPIATAVSDVFINFLHLPPWGYVTVFIETLQNGTSTSLGTLSVSFPTSSPAFGRTIDFDIDSGVTQAIQTIRDEGVTSQYGDSFDTFMVYWSRMVYLLFVIWLVYEILGLVSIEFSYRPNAGNYQKSGIINRGHDRISNKKRVQYTMRVRK